MNKTRGTHARAQPAERPPPAAPQRAAPGARGSACGCRRVPSPQPRGFGKPRSFSSAPPAVAKPPLLCPPPSAPERPRAPAGRRRAPVVGFWSREQQRGGLSGMWKRCVLAQGSLPNRAGGDLRPPRSPVPAPQLSRALTPVCFRRRLTPMPGDPSPRVPAQRLCPRQDLPFSAGGCDGADASCCSACSHLTPGPTRPRVHLLPLQTFGKQTETPRSAPASPTLRGSGDPQERTGPINR